MTREFYEAVERLYTLQEMAKVRSVSPEEVSGSGWFGPVYHGSSEENRGVIDKEGFKVFVGGARAGNVSHGYQSMDYSGGIAPPIHHLGYGIYFTTVKAIAKQYNGGTTKGLPEYYLKVPRLDTINFGSPNTMMKWWLQNGYTGKPGMSEAERVAATEDLTDTLKSQFDAVWYKGKGIRKLLDGDQIVVFNPDNIYRVDNSMSSGYDNGRGVIVRPGDRVQVRDTRLVLNVLKVEPLQRGNLAETPWEALLWPHEYFLVLKMSKKQQADIAAVWHDRLLASVIEHPESSHVAQVQENMSQNHGREVSLEEAAAVVTDWQLSTLSYRFPIALVERTLQPRERLK